MMGVTEARISTPPLRELTEDSSLGYACIEYAQTMLGKNLYPWQKWALIHGLEIVGDLDHDWKFRFRTVLYLISRQTAFSERRCPWTRPRRSGRRWLRIRRAYLRYPATYKG